MEKRYQVFISSTYADLQDERQEVIQALLELDCIPAGMELFPAASEDQWTLIKQVIDDCDYYMVIVAGRYGSMGPDGLSYTEMEYRYALDTEKPIIGFVHKDPGKLAANRTESSEHGKEKLDDFRSLVQKKMCRFWESPSDLGSQVSRSLVKLIKTNPGVGWVRANLVPDESTIEEILGLRRRVEELEQELLAATSHGPEGASGLAQGNDIFNINYTFTASPAGLLGEAKEYNANRNIEWDDIFAAMSPLMIDEASESQLTQALNDLVVTEVFQGLADSSQFKGHRLRSFRISRDDFQTIKIQLRALGLIAKSTKNRSVKDTATYWTLTPYGDTVMTRLRAIKKPAIVHHDTGV
jgi:predicted DNA binding CopG/RHH family protein